MHLRSSIAILTRSERMQATLARIDVIARSETSVLLVGETGVGKELLADYIHRVSPRSEQPLVKVALSAVPVELLESELFGHERGAFTSAQAEKKGLFELAHTGTLFLDDVDDTPLGVQPKLLRALEAGQVMRVGATSPLAVDVRLVSASKVELRELVKRDMFRADLFYRLDVCPVEIPPLRERPEDVTLLLDHFLRRLVPDDPPVLSPEAEQALVSYRWPGNVRELRNVAQRLALFSHGTIRPEDLPPEIRTPGPVEQLVEACVRCAVEGEMNYPEVVRCLETNLLRRVLAQTGGSRSEAARRLGLSLSTLRDKLRKLGLDESRP